MIRILFSEVCNRKSTQRSTLLSHNNMYWKYLGKLTKSDYYIIKRKDSMLIIRRGGTFLPTPGQVRVKVHCRRSWHFFPALPFHNLFGGVLHVSLSKLEIVVAIAIQRILQIIHIKRVTLWNFC